MKYKGKLNLSPLTYTTGMESLYGNLSLCQRTGQDLSDYSGAQGEEWPQNFLCPACPRAVCGAALVLSCSFVEEIKIFLPLPTRTVKNFRMLCQVCGLQGREIFGP